eukprot:gb/GFBE01080135.1/.p1 GENE.gb/GFBE01080135.1/~~gb/GFBE01080135.1/.p1  ORF type:complete len:290 (+),score=61.45 gb/GFBE01080135.1/:1-870(+)
MDGPIVAEFSNLNALNQKAFVAPADRGHAPAQGSLTERSSERHRGGDEVAAGSYTHRERLLRGESTYTAASSDGRVNEHFIEDQPQGLQFGMSHLLPRASTTEERERLLRRLEMCAKAREESTKIMSIRFAQRDAVKHDIKADRRQHFDRMLASQRDRDQRWGRKLQKSPFAVDLVAENQRIDEENRVRQIVEQRRAKSAAARSREAHNKIFKRATAEADELEHLRREKKLLLENERQLKALRDVEKSNARTVQILQARKQRQAQREEEMEARGGSSPVRTPPRTGRSA